MVLSSVMTLDYFNVAKAQLCFWTHFKQWLQNSRGKLKVSAKPKKRFAESWSKSNKKGCAMLRNLCSQSCEFRCQRSYSLFVCQDENENKPEDESFRFEDERTNQASALWYIEGSVRSSCISSEMNQSFGFRLCFRFRLGTWTGYKHFAYLKQPHA